MNFKYFTSEAVMPGHPDKIADQISDLILDEHLKIDANARVAVETLINGDLVVLAGEVSDKILSKNFIEEKIRVFLKSLGYQKHLLNYEEIKIINHISIQSKEIAESVKKAGAGDQGMMFGYATDETDTLMPASIYYANLILQNIKKNTNLGPDGKSQVTIEYDDKGRPVGCSSVVVSVQHTKDYSIKELKQVVIFYIEKSLPKGWMPKSNNIFINPSGSFVKGGPISDCGLTGRKIVADTYGGVVQNGGGAFSGKDPTKVDRSAAYMARYVAKNIVASGIAKKCSIQVCYAIGIDYELSLQINTYGTSKIPQEEIKKLVKDKISFCPQSIASKLCLKNPIYLPTAAWGHFGRIPKSDQGHFTWEQSKSW